MESICTQRLRPFEFILSLLRYISADSTRYSIHLTRKSIARNRISQSDRDIKVAAFSAWRIYENSWLGDPGYAGP